MLILYACYIITITERRYLNAAEIYPNSDLPIYEQLVRQIVVGISRGELKPGEELPSVRQLAADLGINLHTVNKAYQELRQLGYLEIDRRVGTRVREEFSPMSSERDELLQKELQFIIADYINRGVSKENLHEMLLSVLMEVKDHA